MIYPLSMISEARIKILKMAEEGKLDNIENKDELIEFWKNHTDTYIYNLQLRFSKHFSDADIKPEPDVA